MPRITIFGHSWCDLPIIFNWLTNYSIFNQTCIIHGKPCVVIYFMVSNHSVLILCDVMCYTTKHHLGKVFSGTVEWAESCVARLTGDTFGSSSFSNAIQIRWKFRFTLTSILIQWLLQNLYKAQQLPCRGMCKNLLRSDGRQRNNRSGHFHRIWIAGKKNVSETGRCTGLVLWFSIWFALMRIFLRFVH